MGGVLVLTADDDDPYSDALLDAGAASYVLKTAESRDIVRAVRRLDGEKERWNAKTNPPPADPTASSPSSHLA